MPLVTLTDLADMRGLKLRAVLLEAKKFATIREESFYKFANNEMVRYPSDMIDAICEALDCDPGDFIKRKTPDGA